jgi:hypothetical protein
LRACYVVASRVSIFLSFFPPSFLPTSHVPYFLQNQRNFRTHLLFSFLGWLASPGERERERERGRGVKSERGLVCGKKTQEGEFFVNSSCNEGKAYAPDF